jgi:hypothetical protein
MSTPSRMTIAWDRLDQMALLPQDSSVVEPPPKTTIAWTPMLGPTIFDYDPTDFVITPGAGEEAGSPPGETGGGTPPPGTGGGAPHHYGRPHLSVANRRSLKLFLKDGFFVDIHAPAAAHIRAVLETKVKGAKGKPHTVNLTKVLTTEVGTEQRKLTLHPSHGGRLVLSKLKGSVSATLVLLVNYGGGQKRIEIRHHVVIVGG